MRGPITRELASITFCRAHPGAAQPVDHVELDAPIRSPGRPARLPLEQHPFQSQSSLAVRPDDLGVGPRSPPVDVDVAQTGLVTGHERLRPDGIQPTEHQAGRVAGAATQPRPEHPQQAEQRVHAASLVVAVRSRGWSSTAAVGWQT